MREALLTQTFVDAEELGDADSAARIAATLTWNASNRFRLREAERWARELEARIARPETLEPQTRAAAASALSIFATAQGNGEDARRRADEAARLLSEALGEDHPEVLIARGNSVEALLMLGHEDAAASTLGAVIDGLGRSLGPRHPRLASPYQLRASLESSQGQFDDSLESINIAIDILEQSEPSRDLAVALLSRAVTYKSRGDFESARSDYARARTLFLRTEGPGAAVVSVDGALSALALAEGDVQEAVRLARRGLDGIREHLGGGHEILLPACATLVQALLEAEEPEQLRAAFDECEAIDENLESQTARVIGSHLALAEAARSLGLSESANAHRERARRLGWPGDTSSRE